MQQKPTLINVIAWSTLASGIINVLWGIGLSATVVLSTIGFGLICTPVTILPTVLGIFEILYAAKLLSNPPQPVRPSQTIAILEIVCLLAGNLFSMVVGILSLVFYNDQIVKDYFARLNGTLPAAPIVPVAPVAPVSPVPPVAPDPIVDPIPTPDIDEPMQPVEPPLINEDETPRG
jgi:hypothetical protein